MPPEMRMRPRHREPRLEQVKEDVRDRADEDRERGEPAVRQFSSLAGFEKRVLRTACSTVVLTTFHRSNTR